MEGNHGDEATVHSRGETPTRFVELLPLDLAWSHTQGEAPHEDASGETPFPVVSGAEESAAYRCSWQHPAQVLSSDGGQVPARCTGGLMGVVSCHSLEAPHTCEEGTCEAGEVGEGGGGGGG